MHWGRDKMSAIFKCIFLNENVHISIMMSLKFVPWGQINNIVVLVQTMAWCRSLVYWRKLASIGLNELIHQGDMELLYRMIKSMAYCVNTSIYRDLYMINF